MNIRGTRIALFTGAYNHIADGVSLTLNRLVAFLERNGAEIMVFAPSVPDPPLRHAGRLVPVRSISAPGRPEYRLSLGLSGNAMNSLTDFRPDLFHIATPDLLGLAALRHARCAGKPVVASYHTHFASYLKYYRLESLERPVWSYLRWFYARCRQVYVPTQSMISVLETHGIRGNLRLWPRGVESDLFNPRQRSTQWRHAHGVSDGEVLITFVSRLVMEKGLNIVIDVARALKERAIPHRMLIVGDGPERAHLQSALPEAIFEGHQTGHDLATAYASSDLFLFPSDTETFGNVTLEALASGLPAIVADATGSNALVRSGFNGFLAAPRDSRDFLDKTEMLATDTDLRRTMSSNARTSAESYDWENVLGQIIAYYGELE